MASLAKLQTKVSCTRRAPAARRMVVAAASNRTLWLPGVVAPAHLTGKMAGDAGFDPLGLGADAERVKWYQEAEKTNGRWAMAAVAGILFTEAAGIEGASKWWIADRAKDYGAPLLPLIATTFTIMGFLEMKRFEGWKQTGTSGFINSFPFDPVKMNSAEMQVKEVKNGRLAMVAFAGFMMQALVSGTGPLEGLGKHLADPSYNITYTLTHLQEIKHY